jgi:DNA-binding transcriptional ArsR family regulator
VALTFALLRASSANLKGMPGLDIITVWLYNQYIMIALKHDAQLDATFAALADPTRRTILARLAQGEATVTELTAPFSISQPAISKHLKVLERAGLIVIGQDAQRRPRRLEIRAMTEAMLWLEHHRAVWEANYARLDALLKDLQAKPAVKRRKTKKP